MTRLFLPGNLFQHFFQGAVLNVVAFPPLSPKFVAESFPKIDHVTGVVCCALCSLCSLYTCRGGGTGCCGGGVVDASLFVGWTGMIFQTQQHKSRAGVDGTESVRNLDAKGGDSGLKVFSFVNSLINSN